MCSSGTSISDIEKTLSEIPVDKLFDLAVKNKQGTIRRVSFSAYKAVDRNMVVGIYPFKNDERFLELEEKHHSVYNIYPWTTRWGEEEIKDIPNEHDFERINQILNPLNDALKNIAAKIYDDLYVIRGFGGYKAVATFNWRKDLYPLDWHAPMVRLYRKPQNYLPPYLDDTVEVQLFDIKKEDALREIADLMAEYGIAVYDIKQGLKLVTPFEAMLDLLVGEENGELTRVPFAQRQAIPHERIVGLYPFKDEDKALDVNEYLYRAADNGVADAMNKSDLQRFNEVLPLLNSALEEIEASPLRGKYHVFRNINSVKCPDTACTKDIAPEDAESFPENIRYYWDISKNIYKFIDGRLQYTGIFFSKRY